MEGGRLRRSALGPEMRAQSSGEWPGVRITLRLGLEGLAECVGGGRSEEEEEGVGPRLGTGPRARWGEFAAGKAARRGGTGPREEEGGGGGMLPRPGREFVEVLLKRGGGGGMLPRPGAGGGGMLPRPRVGVGFAPVVRPVEEGSLRENEGTAGPAGVEGVALGVVCSSSGSDITGAGVAFGRRMIAGGGGMARASFFGAGSGSSGKLMDGGAGAAAVRFCSSGPAAPLLGFLSSSGGGLERVFGGGGRDWEGRQVRRKGGMKGCIHGGGATMTQTTEAMMRETPM